MVAHVEISLILNEQWVVFDVEFGLFFFDSFGFTFSSHQLLTTIHRPLTTNLLKQGLVAGGAEEVAGVEVALSPGFFGRLLKLPVVEPRPKALTHRLILPRSIVVTQSVIR